MLLISNDIGLRKAMGSNMHWCFERRKPAGKETTLLYSDDASPLRPPADLVVAYLGPGGTHSHLMAIALFGAVDELGFRYEPRNTLASVLDAVRTRAVGWGVVPYFNTSSGPVRTIYPALIDIEHGGFEDLEVSACVSWPVSHDLLGTGRMDRIERVYSKQEAIDQCSRFLKEHFNPKQILPADSTAEAVRTAEREGPHSAAIASRRVCEFHPGVDTVCQDIQDDRRNLTRFLIIRRRPAGLEPVREHNRHRRMRHTWVVFDSSAQSAVLPRMMAVARDWGIAASTLIGVVTDPSAFGMRFLLELDWPRDSLKVQFLLGDTEHLRRRVVAWPMVADSDQISVIREWIAAQICTTETRDEDCSEMLKLLAGDIRARLNGLSHWRLFSHAPVETMADVWAVLGLPAGRVINSQVLYGRTTHDLAICCVPAGRRVSDAKVSRLLSGEYRRLKRTEFGAHGLKPGTVSPLSAPADTLIFMDTSFVDSGWFFMGSGHSSISIAVRKTPAEWPFSVRVAEIAE